NCRMLFTQLIPEAFSLALASSGSSSQVRIAMMAMTTNSSINVKAARFRGRPVRRTQGVRIDFCIGILSLAVIGLPNRITARLPRVNCPLLIQCVRLNAQETALLVGPGEGPPRSVPFAGSDKARHCLFVSLRGSP